MNWVFSSYSPVEHRTAVTELQQLLWAGGRDGNGAYLDWKYFHNPYIADPYIVLAWEEHRLAGMIGAFGASWEVPGAGREILPCLSDTVVRSEHRGTPLFRLMLDRLVERLAADGIPWLLDFGDQPAGPAMLMRGWKPLGPWAIAKTAGRASALVIGGDDDALQARIGRRSGKSIRRRTSIDVDAVARLIMLTEDASRIRHVRDAQYLTWRFANPLAHYYYLTAGDDPMEGYLLAHRTRVDLVDGITPTTIMDCEASADSVWADLVEAALDWLPGREVVMWTRDLTPARLQVLADLGLTLLRPSGRITVDVVLPNLLICWTSTPSWHRATGAIADPALWDLRSICGRSWR